MVSYQRIARSVVRIEMRTGTEYEPIGTGYLLSNDEVVTAKHVVDNIPVDRLRVVRAVDDAAEVVSNATLSDNDLDGAVLRVRGFPLATERTIGRRLRDVRPLDRCMVIGYPAAGAVGAVSHPTYVDVRVLPALWGKPEKLSLQVKTPLPNELGDWRGLSGAGVVDESGRLLGIVSSASRRWDGQLQAISIEALREAATSTDARALAAIPITELPREGSLFDYSMEPSASRDFRKSSLFDLLHFRNQIVRYIPDKSREEIMERARTWLNEETNSFNVSIMLLTGPAGAGKSRLAIEACDRMKQGTELWETGFVDYKKLATADLPTVPTLAVCDYPERNPEHLGAFLARVQRQDLSVPLRIILVSRYVSDWYQRIRDHVPNLDSLVECRAQIELSEFNREQRTRHAEQAFAFFSEGLGVEPELRRQFDPDQVQFDRPLTIHIAALLAAFGEEVPNPKVDRRARESLLNQLTRREGRRWLDYRTESGQVVFSSLARGMEALCVASLTAPSTRHFPELLRTAESFRDASAEYLHNVTDAVYDLYPRRSHQVESLQPAESSIAPIEPDLIAAFLLANTAARPEMIERLVTSRVLADNPEYHAQLLQALLLAADEYPQVRNDLDTHLVRSLSVLAGVDKDNSRALVTLLTQNLPELVNAAVRQLNDTQDPTAVRQLGLALNLPGTRRNGLIAEQASEIIASDVVQFHPFPAVSWLGAALASQAILLHENEYASTPTDAALERLARAYMTLQYWLSATGELEKAVSAAQRSVDLFENLARDGRVEHLALLSQSVDELAKRLLRVSRWNDAVLMRERNLELHRQLVDIDRESHLAGLIGCMEELLNLKRQHRDINTEMATELRDMCTEMVRHNPDLYRQRLAKIVGDLSADFAIQHHWEQALENAEFAIGLYKEILNPSRLHLLPDVARVLVIAARALSHLRLREKVALGYARYAVEIYEGIVDGRPGLYSEALNRARYLEGSISRRLNGYSGEWGFDLGDLMPRSR